MITPKKGSVESCLRVDLTKLTQFVKRELYQSPTHNVSIISGIYIGLSGSYLLRPLFPTLNSYRLDEIEKPILQCLRMTSVPYKFHEEWVSRKDHVIADAISPALVNAPTIQNMRSKDKISKATRNPSQRYHVENCQKNIRDHGKQSYKSIAL